MVTIMAMADLVAEEEVVEEEGGITIDLYAKFVAKLVTLQLTVIIGMIKAFKEAQISEVMDTIILKAIKISKVTLFNHKILSCSKVPHHF